MVKVVKQLPKYFV